jgi:uncharacterized protein YndB with AHSA1/START domain
MIAFQTSVGIERPLEDVFAYVSDPCNLPDWNTAVQAVRPTSPRSTEVGATYSMQRQLPTGHATNQLKIVARKQPHEFAIRTTTGPTPFRYHYRFAAHNGHTIVHLDAQLQLSGLAAFTSPLARRAVQRGVDDNLATLKHNLEKPNG